MSPVTRLRTDLGGAASVVLGYAIPRAWAHAPWGTLLLDLIPGGGIHAGAAPVQAIAVERSAVAFLLERAQDPLLLRQDTAGSRQMQSSMEGFFSVEKRRLRVAGATIAQETNQPVCRAKEMVGVARFELATPSPPD